MFKIMSCDIDNKPILLCSHPSRSFICFLPSLLLLAQYTTTHRQKPTQLQLNRTMQRNRPGPTHFKTAFPGGPNQDITARPPLSRATTTLRPINHAPGWLETILMRPIRVECWSCLRLSWLHRGQREATPYDWTCLNCQTHQRRDKVPA